LAKLKNCTNLSLKFGVLIVCDIEQQNFSAPATLHALGEKSLVKLSTGKKSDGHDFSLLTWKGCCAKSHAQATNLNEIFLNKNLIFDSISRSYKTFFSSLKRISSFFAAKLCHFTFNDFFLHVTRHSN